MATAKTTTWSGGSSGKFSSADNWNNGAPGAGDTAVFTKSVSLESETVTLGDGTLTIDSAVTITSSAVFAGTGAITKTGGGGLTFNARQTFTGKLTMQGGELNIAVDDALRASSADFYGSASLRSGGTSYVLNVPVNIFDCTTSTFSAGSTSWTYNELVSANCDFTVSTYTGNVSFRKGISAPGHTVTLDYNDSNKKSATLYGTINASVRKTRNGPLTVDSACVIAGGLSIEEGTQSCGKVMLTNSGNLLPTAVVKLNPGAVLELGANITVSELWFGGEKQAEDAYAASHSSGHFAGSGVLTVDQADPALHTWVGGASGLWSEAANWSPAQVPGAGDKAVFTKSVTLESETVTLGEGTLTIDNAATLACGTVFAGPAALAICGAGKTEFTSAQTITGGATISAGDTWMTNAEKPLGSGTIVVTGSGVLHPQPYWSNVSSDLVLADVGTQAALVGNGPGNWTGAVTANCDFTISTGWQALNVTGAVSAPGHAMTVDFSSGSDRKITLSSTVNADKVVKRGTGEMFVAAAGKILGDLSVEAGTVTLQGSDNLAATSVVRLSAGATLNLSANVAVSELWIDNVKQEDGAYTSAHGSGLITGSGTLTVKAFDYTLRTWVGGASGLWSEAANWSPAQVPGAGDKAVFTKSVTLESETVTLGEGTLTIDNAATLACGTVFAGTGAITKTGGGALKFSAVQTFSGGLTVVDGRLDALDASNPFGSGDLTFTGGGYLLYNCWEKHLTNAIHIVDTDASRVLVANGPLYLDGSISANCDFAVGTDWQVLYFRCPIAAEGHMITVSIPDTQNAKGVSFGGPVAAKIRKTGSAPLTLGGSFWVSEFWDGEVRLADGKHSATDRPDVFAGSGTLYVGEHAKLWTGGSSGALSDPANWSSATVPAEGDALYFTKSVTLEAETVTLGEGEFTIDSSADLVCNATLAGAMTLVKRGSGKLTFGAKQTFAGGFRIESGRIETPQASDPLGTGVVEISGTGSLRYNAWQGYFNQEIRISDVGSQSVVVGNGPGYFSGTISATCDFAITTDWEVPVFTGLISAPGRTMTANVGADKTIRLTGTVNASVCKTGAGQLTLSGMVTENLTIEGGKVSISGSDNLSPTAIVRLSSGAKLVLADTLAVAELWVGDEKLEAGKVYDASNLGDSLEGSGKLAVGFDLTQKKWVGGTSGTFSDAANWYPPFVPAPGDTLTVSHGVTFEAETFALGAGTLTFYLPGTVNSNVKFTGPGAVKVTGSSNGLFGANVDSEHTGGTFVPSGSLMSCGCETFGSEKISVSGTGRVQLAKQGAVFANDIEIGADYASPSGWAVWTSQAGKVTGAVTSAADFGVRGGWDNLTFDGAVTAPGHTITACGYNGTGSSGGKVIFNGSVDASLVKIGPRDVEIAAECPSAANALTVRQGTLKLMARGRWCGTSVTVDGEEDGTARLVLAGAGNLSESAVVKLLNGGMLKVDVTTAVAELWIGDQQLESGVYSAADLPDSLAGAGCLIVGHHAKTWIGGATGLFSAAANWSDGQSPTDGDILIVTNKVTFLAEEMAVSGEGFVLINSGEVVCTAVMTGSGTFAKYGAGTFQLGTNRSDCAWTGFTGKLSVMEGQFAVNDRGTAATGTGVLEVGAAKGEIRFSAYGTSIINSQISVVGTSDSPRIIFSNGGPVNVYSDIVSDSDFKVVSYWGAFRLRGNVTASGRTVTFESRITSDADTPCLHVYKAVNANVVKTGAGELTMYGQSVGTDNTYTVENGTNFFDSAASWAGTSVAVTGDASLLAITSARNLSSAASVAVGQAAKVDVADGVKLRVAAAAIDGHAVPAGLYTAETLPGLLVGDGKLVVGNYGGMVPETITVDANTYQTALPVVAVDTVVDVPSVGRISFENFSGSLVGRQFVIATGTSFNMPDDFLGWSMEPSTGGLNLSFSVSNGKLVAEVKQATKVYPAGNGEVRVALLEDRIETGFFSSDWTGYSASGLEYDANGAGIFTIDKGGSHEMSGTVAVTQVDDKTVRLTYSYTPKQAIQENNGLYVTLRLPAAQFAGGVAKLVKSASSSTTKNFPTAYDPGWEVRKDAKEIKLRDKSDNLVFHIDNTKANDASTTFSTLLKDSREDADTGSFSVRITFTDDALSAGRTYKYSFDLELAAGCLAQPGGQVRIVAGDDYAAMNTAFGWIGKGSVLDFSKQRGTDAPAGNHGRVVRRGPHFEFANLPGVPQRFYGINLCRSTALPDKAYAERLAVNLARMGYNAVRIHRHDAMVAAGGDALTGLNAGEMDKFDYLIAKCIENGLYITTDLQIERMPTYRSCGISKDGAMTYADYMILMPVNETVYQNFATFTSAFFSHVNPYTGRSLAEEPAVAGLSIVNEGSIMSFPPKTLLAISDWNNAWRTWLAAKRQAQPSIYGSMTDDAPSSISDGAKGAAYVIFRSEMEVAFVSRVKALLASLGCMAPITDMNNPWAQGSTSFSSGSVWGGTSFAADCLVRSSALDYVDQHIYWDHPSFFGEAWRAPWRQTAKNPLSIGSLAGFTGKEMMRQIDHPFTISEYNYCAPQSYRSIGGLLMGSMAALQDWDGLWRFDWSSGANGYTDPSSGSQQTLDVAFDPVTRATERALVPLFLRRDLAPLTATRAVPLRASDYANPGDNYLVAEPKFYDAGWYAKLGTVVTNALASGDQFASSLANATGKTRSEVRALMPTSAGDGHISYDAAAGTFSVTSDRTVGGYRESGTVMAGALSAQLNGGAAAVWVTSVDGRSIATSRRMLFTHLTDTQNSRTVYASVDRDLLIDNGGLPLVMRTGSANVSLQLGGSDGLCRVWAVGPDGTRRNRIASAVNGGGVLSFSANVTADPSDVSYLYEIERMRQDSEGAYLLDYANDGTCHTLAVEAGDAMTWPVKVKLDGAAPAAGSSYPVLTVPISVRTLVAGDIVDTSACARGTRHKLRVETADGVQTVYLDTTAKKGVVLVFR